MTFSAEQKKQEDLYGFPYHYLDLRSDEHRLITGLELGVLLETALAELAPRPGERILDAGCGDGRLCLELRRRGAVPVGVDFSDRAIGFARAFNPGVEFHVQDLTQLRVAGPFAAAVSIETIEHIPVDQVDLVIRNIADALEPGGRFVMTVPSTNVPRNDKHYQHFSPETLRRALEPHFEVEKIIGRHRLDGPLRRFKVRRALAKQLFGLRHSLPLAARALESVGAYYRRHVATGPADSCGGLVAVARKRAES